MKKYLRALSIEIITDFEQTGKKNIFKEFYELPENYAYVPCRV